MKVVVSLQQNGNKHSFELLGKIDAEPVYSGDMLNILLLNEQGASINIEIHAERSFYNLLMKELGK